MLIDDDKINNRWLSCVLPHAFVMNLKWTRRKRGNKQNQDLEKLKMQVDGGGEKWNSLTLIVFTLLAIHIFIKLFDLSIAYSLARSFLFCLTLSQLNSLLPLLPHSISLSWTTRSTMREKKNSFANQSFCWMRMFVRICCFFHSHALSLSFLLPCSFCENRFIFMAIRRHTTTYMKYEWRKMVVAQGKWKRENTENTLRIYFMIFRKKENRKETKRKYYWSGNGFLSATGMDTMITTAASVAVKCVFSGCRFIRVKEISAPQPWKNEWKRRYETIRSSRFIIVFVCAGLM